MEWQQVAQLEFDHISFESGLDGLFVLFYLHVIGYILDYLATR